MSESKRCKSCGNPIDLEVAKAHDGACPWCLAAFTFGPEPVGNLATASKDPSKQFGKYVRTEKLGAGGMGEVWKALDPELNRWVALKFLKADDPNDLARFKREAQMAASLSHPNIAAVYEVGEIEGRQYIAMQCVDGLTMDAFPRKDRALLVRLCRDAALALDHAHRHRVIHRDVKPGNLMVEQTEDGYRVMVLDFGLARPIEGGEKLSMSGSIGGTAAYMSPEQARGGVLDKRADVYSLGASLYEVLTGRAPFEGENVYEVLKAIENSEPPRPRKLDPQIHRDLETIVLKCLEKDRNRRYDSARELAEDLDRFLGHEPILARPASTLYRLKMRLGKRKAVMATALAGLAGIVAVAALIVGGQDRLAEARAWAGTHVDLARLKLDQLEQLMGIDEDRRVEIEKLASGAGEELGEALRECPAHEEACFEMGRMFALTRRADKALEYFTRAIQLAPRQTKSYLARATLNLDAYEELRHVRGTGRVRAESDASRKLLDELNGDLQKIRSQSTEVPQLKYAEGMLLFAKGEYAEAAARLGEYLNLAPADASGWLWRGHALVHAKAPAEAVQALTRALAIRPRLSYAYVLRGIVQEELGRFDEAIADSTRAIELNPKYHSAYTNRASAKASKGLHDAADADYTMAIDRDPKNARVYCYRGRSKLTQGLRDEAIADFSKAIELDAKYAIAYANRGVAKNGAGRHDEAIADLTRALELEPDNALAYMNRGNAKMGLGLYDDAIADYTKATEVDPKLASAFHNRGIVRSDRGLHREAIVDYTKAIEADPKHAMSYYNRGVEREALGLHDEAIADYTKAIELDPKDAPSFGNRGLVQYRLRRYDEAIADCTRAIELDPKDALPWMNRGNAKHGKGRHDEAIADLTKAVELEPKLAGAWAGRGLANVSRRFHDEAIADFTKAIELDPKDAAYPFNRGFAKAGKGLQDDAIADYTKAIELDPKYAHAYYNRGVAKSLKGLHDEAIADFKKALEFAPPEWPPRAATEAYLAVPREAILFREGSRLHESKKYREAIAQFKAVVEGHPKSREAVSSAYNIACAHALLGEKKEALNWLEKSVQMGWSDLSHLEDDQDLESLRGETRYRKLVEKLKSE